MFQNCVYKFGVFELNVSARELRKHGVKIRLSGQPFALLGMLLESPGQIVTREEMRLRLWSADTIVDFEHSLNSAIKKLRAALGDSPENSRYIETVPKIGYRFIAPVEAVVPDSAVPGSGPPRLPDEERAQSSDTQEGASRGGSPLWMWIAAACAVALAIMAISRTFFRPATPGAVSASRVMIAVLPFENLTGDASQEYFSEGLTEEMIEQLGRVDPKRLGVIARTSAARYQRQGASLEKIQRELGVQYVLEGTVRRDAERVRITAELIQLKDQSHVWSREYDRSLDEVVQLQGELAQQLSHELTIAFSSNPQSPDARALSPEGYRAYDLYLKGRFFWNKRTKQGFERALECFQQATSADPKYSRAYAGIADTYALIAGYYMAPIADISLKARTAANKAIELDPALPEAHTALALIAQNIDWDWNTAEREYRRAIELDANYATAHHWYAEELSLVGRFDEALSEIEVARQLDPLSLIIATDRGAILYYSRRYDLAIQQFRSVLDMDPQFARSRMIENAYAQKGMLREALADAEEWQHLEDGPWRTAIRAYLLGRSGNREQALEAAAYLKKKYGDYSAIDPLQALISIGLDDREAAVSSLEHAYENHTISTAIAVDPSFDSIRSTPRFQAILQKMHFPSNVRASAGP